MKLYVTIILLVFITKMYGQEYYFVTAENGLNVRSEATLSSKKVGKLKFGTMVEKIADTEFSMTINDNDKQITGKFVKVKYNKMFFIEEDIEGYVFDGYLKKVEDDTLLNIIKIDVVAYKQLEMIAAKEGYFPKRISDIATVKGILKDRVTWYENDYVKSIKLENGEELLFDKDAVDFGFSVGQSGYYPEEQILVLEGGHGTDVCFSIKTGESELTIGNPEYSMPSPKNTYRLNGSFGGQECISYFFQKYENGNYRYVTALNWDYDICTLRDFHWISENEFIYKKMTYYKDSEKSIEEYYKGKILEN